MSDVLSSPGWAIVLNIAIPFIVAGIALIFWITFVYRFVNKKEGKL